MLEYHAGFDLQSLQCSWVYAGGSLARGSPWFPVPPPQARQRQCLLRAVCHVPFLLSSTVSLLVIAIIFAAYGNLFLHLLMSWGSFMIPAIPFFPHVMAVRAGQRDGSNPPLCKCWFSIHLSAANGEAEGRGCQALVQAPY